MRTREAAFAEDFAYREKAERYDRLYEREREMVAEYRRKNPRSRAVGILRYSVNTSSRRGMECILCGERGPTWSAKWPETKRAIEWAVEHRTSHLEEGEE